MPAFAAAFALVGAAPAFAAPEFDCVIDPSETVKLGSPITGLLSEVLVKRGALVEQGMPVARLESSLEQANVKLGRLRAESTARIDAQREKATLTRARLSRTSKLIATQVATQDRFEEQRADAHIAEQELLREEQEQKLAELELERAQAQLEQRTIRSPISGIVSEKKLSAGEFINQDGYVATVAKLDPLHVEVFLPVAHYPQVEVGQSATVHPAAPIGGEYQAKIIVVDRIFDPASGTFGVRLALPNPGNRLPAGQRCKVEFPFSAAASENDGK
jgi:RND family efflux transporter MFP subunit